MRPPSSKKTLLENRNVELRAVSNMKALGKPLNAKQTAVPR